MADENKAAEHAAAAEHAKAAEAKREHQPHVAEHASPEDRKAVEARRAADDKRTAEVRKKHEQERETRSKVQAEQRASMEGTPTPTQDEADQIKLGLYPEIAPDGSTDPFAPADQKQATAERAKPGQPGYATRQAVPKP